MKFVIEGDPIPKMRARTFVRGKRTMTFDPQHAKKITTQIKLTEQLRKAFDSKDKQNVMKASGLAHNDAFAVTLTFFMPIPKSLPKGQKNAISWGSKHNHKPDVDNLAKYYLDCANGLLYSDDSKIISLLASKEYSDNPRTEIEVMPIKIPHYEYHMAAITKLLSPNEFKEFIYDMEKLSLQVPKDMGEVADLPERSWFPSYCTALAEFSRKYNKMLNKLAKLSAFRDGKTLC